MEEDMEKIVFPACAGVIPTEAMSFDSSNGIPRVCGGDPNALRECGSEMKYSPRVRG